MKRLALAAMVMAAAATAVLADTVQVKGMPAYEDCKVVGVSKDLQLQIEVNGRTLEKSLAVVQRITITGQTSFNEGEEAFSKNKPADAIKAYDQAGDADVLRNLLPARRLRALDAAKLIERSTTEWLTVMEFSGGSKVAAAMRPKKMAAKGSKSNAAAIALLEDKLERLDKKGDYPTAVKRLLLDLYQVQGAKAKADKLTSELTGKTADNGADTPDGSDDTASVSDENVGGLIQASAALYKSGKHKDALATLASNLDKYTTSDLPDAMLLMGKCQLALKAKADGKEARELLLEAGLNFMRVATFFPTVEEAPEALYLAGMVNLELGNKPAAIRAFDRLMTSDAESKFALQAKVQMDRLSKEK